MPARTVLALCVAAVAVVVALAGALQLISPVPLVETRARPVGAELKFSWTPPTQAPAPAAATLTRRTPADAALAAVVGDGVFTGYQHQSEAEDTLYGGPYAGACKGLLGTGPVAGVMRRAHQGTAALAVTGWAYTAGGGAAAVATARRVLNDCSAPADARPRFVAVATPNGTGFVVSSGNGGDGVTWMLWARGDVVLAVTGTTPSGPGPHQAVSALAKRVDTAAVAALRTTCVTLDPDAGDRTRNPYVPGYRPYSYATELTVPGVGTTAPHYFNLDPVEPTPTTPADTAPAGTTPSGADATGSGGSPEPTPAAEQVPELAPLVLPAAWVPGDPVPAPELAEHGPAPLLVRPESIPVPEDVVTSEPTPPGTIPAAESVTRFSVAEADSTGPGCGWEFTGVPAPRVDVAALQARTRAAAEKAFVDLAHAQVDTKLAAARRALDQQVYDHDLASWQRYQDYQDRVDRARAAWAAAERVHADSVRQLTRLYHRYQDSLTNPTLPDPTAPTPSGPPTTPDTQGPDGTNPGSGPGTGSTTGPDPGVNPAPGGTR